MDPTQLSFEGLDESASGKAYLITAAFVIRWCQTPTEDTHDEWL